MDGMTDSDRALLRETHDAVIELNSVVLGAKGQGGLMNSVRDLRDKFSELSLNMEKDRLQLTLAINDINYIKPKVKELDSSLNDDETGVCTRLNSLEIHNKGISKGLTALWAVLASVSATIITLVLTHVLS